MDDYFVKLFINTKLTLDEVYEIFILMGFKRDDAVKHWLSDDFCTLVIDRNDEFSIDKSDLDFNYYPFTVDIETCREDDNYVNRVIEIVSVLKGINTIIDVIPACDFEEKF